MEGGGVGVGVEGGGARMDGLGEGREAGIGISSTKLFSLPQLSPAPVSTLGKLVSA